MATTQDTKYVDPILKRYVDLIQQKTGSRFRGVYYGDPVRVPASLLPALVVAKRSTVVGNFNNAEDGHEMTIIFTVITDIRKDIGEDNFVVAGVGSLYDIIEGRDQATLILKPDSLVNILRNNAELDVSKNLRTDLTSNTKIDYGMTLNKRAEDHWGIEGTVTIVSNITQLR